MTHRWLRRGSIPPRAQEMLDLVDLAGFANRYPHELSGGEAQRVALARALAPAPAAVLLDEPFSNLDQNLRSSLRLQLREILRAADTAAVFVTHDREEALSLADRIAVMRAGTVEQVGAPIEIYHHPANRFVASFVGNANVLHGDRSRHGAETPMGASASPAAAPTPTPASRSTSCCAPNRSRCRHRTTPRPNTAGGSSAASTTATTSWSACGSIRAWSSKLDCTAPKPGPPAKPSRSL